LAGLVALLRLVDDIDAALAAHQTVVAMAIAQRFQRVTDFHGRHQRFFARGKTHGGQNRRRSYAANRRADQEWDISELASDRPREIGAPCASRRIGRTADMLTLLALALFQTNSVGTLVDELIGGSS